MHPSRQPLLNAILWMVATWLPHHLHGQNWRSSLYPDDWQRPDQTVSFYSDMLLQDFSFAGYKRGEQPIPVIAGPVFDAVSYGADPSGINDSTLAIQAAINAAASAGGGVVTLPAGEFRISPQASNTHCLLIAASNIVLRGAGAVTTRLFNTSTSMTDKRVILVAPPSTGTGPSVNLIADLDGPTRRIPVASPASFNVGDIIRMQWTFTDEWIAEHGQESYWSVAGGKPSDARYLRQVVDTNVAEGWIEIDIPTRYSMKTRDNARVMTRSGMLSGVGIENLSIGNVQHAGSDFLDSDYTIPGTAAYDTHASWLLEMRDVHDCWITGVESYQHASNTTTCHMLSNGIALNNSCRVTVRDCAMRRPQYGGGGGNGYMFRLQYANDCLVQDSIADFSRHGFVISHAGTSGNVFHRCDDIETQRATGSTGSYVTGGSGSDNHMHFSHSNLWDQCTAHNSYYTASHRGNSGTVPHALTSAHSVYWNTTGSGTRYSDIVRSNQSRYGYVIGTSGSQSGATNPTTGNTAPADHLEGIGSGATLEPPSLYLDQLSRRLIPRINLTSPPIVQLPNNTFTVDAAVTLDGLPVEHADTINWNTLVSPTGAGIVMTDSMTGRQITVSHPGTYTLEVTTIHDGTPLNATTAIEVLPPSGSGQAFDLYPIADSHVQSGSANENTNFGTSTELLIKNDGGANVQREAFMRFDLSGVDTSAIASATLNLYFTRPDTDANGRTSVVDDTANWGETTVTWLNRPTTQKAAIADWTPVAQDWIAIDVTSAISGELEANDTITFRHQILSQSAAAIYRIASREYATTSLRPFLNIQLPTPTLDQWLADTSGLPTQDRNPDDDPDGDWMANAIEAWLGTNAGLANPTAAPKISRHDGLIEFQMMVNAAPPGGLFYYLEQSDDLAIDSWQLTPGVTWESTGPETGGRIPTSARLNDPGSPRRFYRFVVVAP